MLHKRNLATLLAECAQCKIAYWQYEACEEVIDEALGLLGITVKLDGKLGKRTKYQQFDLA